VSHEEDLARPGGDRETAPFLRSTASLGSAVKWAYLMNWTEQGVSALVLFFMASLLGPRIFGIVTMAMIFLSLLEIFLDQGFSTALIQRKNVEEGHANVAFWIILATSLTFLLVSWGLAEPWAKLNDTPEVAIVLQVLALRLPINAASRVHNALILRSMDYRTVAVRNSAAVILGGISGIVSALCGLGVWALVIQQLVKEVAGTLLIWRLSSWRPNWLVGSNYVRDLWGFSRANLLARLGMFAGQQGDAMLVGLYLGPTAVGIYRLATRVVSLGMQLGAQSLQTVSLPALSRSQHDPAAMARVARKLLTLSLTVSLPMFALLAAISPAIIAVLGQEWSSGAPVLAVLCISGIFGSFSQFTIPILQAASAPALAARIVWFQSITGVLVFLIVANVYADKPDDLQLLAQAAARVAWGALLAVGVAALIALPRVGLRLADLGKLALPSFAAALAGVGVCVLVGRVLSSVMPHIPLLQLVTQAIPGVTASALVLLFLEPLARSYVKKILSSRHNPDSVQPREDSRREP
jgi:PST family polysaccharide transporter